MLIVFGDSHSIIFGGGIVLSSLGDNKPTKFRSVQVNYLVDALGYNLCDSSGVIRKWRLEVESRLNVSVNSGVEVDAVLLAFGEIDIRNQLIRRAFVSGLNLRYAVLDLAVRIVLFARYINKKFSVPVFVLPPTATCNAPLNFCSGHTFERRPL